MVGCPVGGREYAVELGRWRGFKGCMVGALDGSQAFDDGCFAGNDGRAVLPAVGGFGEVLALLPDLADASMVIACTAASAILPSMMKVTAWVTSSRRAMAGGLRVNLSRQSPAALSGCVRLSLTRSWRSSRRASAWSI